MKSAIEIKFVCLFDWLIDCGKEAHVMDYSMGKWPISKTNMAAAHNVNGKKLPGNGNGTMSPTDGWTELFITAVFFCC